MIEKLIILGGHIQALGLARQAAKKGVAVELIIQDKYAVARWSRSIQHTHICPDEGSIIEKIKERATPNTILFPTSDDYIEILYHHRQELDKLAQVALPKNETVELFANKRNTYQFAEQHNIPHPHSYYPCTMQDVENIAKQIDYPCVVKPGVMYSFHEQFGKKAFLCENAKALIERMQQIDTNGYPLDSMLIQEYMAGGAKNLYSFGTFAVKGISVADIQANRIRQNPMDFGNSTTYCVTCNHPEIRQAAEQILELTQYTGMAEIEFMYDKGEYKFLEINTRAWKWHTISNQLGFSFIGALIDTYNGVVTTEGVGELRKKGAKGLTSEEVAWCERLTDFTVAAKEILHGRMTLKEVCASYKIKHESAVWSWRDPLPAIMYILLSPILYVKRH